MRNLTLHPLVIFPPNAPSRVWMEGDRFFHPETRGGDPAAPDHPAWSGGSPAHGGDQRAGRPGPDRVSR